MRGVDTNVLLRPLAQDDPHQAAVVETFFRELEARGERLFVSCIVLCEASWSLRGLGFSRVQIAATLEKLLETALFEIQDRDLVRRALAQFRQGPADFRGLPDRLAEPAGRLCRDGDFRSRFRRGARLFAPHLSPGVGCCFIEDP